MSNNYEIFYYGGILVAMKIKKITTNKKQYLSLLLLADEQESMVDKYLDRGNMYVLFQDDTAISECVVTYEGNKILEIKNLATNPDFQHQGYAQKLVEFIEQKYRGQFDILQVGTGDSPLTLPFYEKIGFRVSGRKRNFFVDNYDHPIFEAGKQLVDMIYLQKRL